MCIVYILSHIQVLIPEMTPHYEMPVMVPVHPEFSHDTPRGYHITPTADGSIDTSYPEFRVGYYTQHHPEVQEVYRHNMNMGNHWPSPPTPQRDRHSNNSFRREKRPDSAGSSYSGAHSDNTQVYPSRFVVVIVVVVVVELRYFRTEIFMVF